MAQQIVTITLDGQPHTCLAGASLGSVLAGAGRLEMPCGGHGHCGKCRVYAAGALSAPTAAERRLLTPQQLAAGLRLACCAKVLGPCSVQSAPSGEGSQIRADGLLPALRLRPGFAHYGAAVDIGTTTLAARLYDGQGRQLAAAGARNPQAAYGADVITRMEAALRGEGDRLAAAVRSAVDELLCAMARQAGIHTDEIDGAVLTGNTVMLHLLTGTDPKPLTHAPFCARRLFGETVPAAAVGLAAMAAPAPVYLPRCAAAFVGADTMTALLAAGLCEGSATQALIDIGTNGEMALWHAGVLYACSTAAGPAFEGAGISMGMGGAAGAIDHVQVTAQGGLSAHVIGGGAPVGICGSGLVDAVACLLATGRLEESGYLEEDPAELLAPVALTQRDIRAVQLAKSAIHAGLRTLVHAAGLGCEDVQTLYVAGGFGSWLNVASAGAIGLLPAQLVPRVQVLGNAALTGAAMLLLDTSLRPASAARADAARIVELSGDPVFAREYADCMLF